jgi:putative ABC transport system permease protein
MTAELHLSDRLYADPARRQRFVDDTLRRLAAEPGVGAVAAANTVPYGQGYSQRTLRREGEAEADASAEARTTDLVRVTPDFLATMAVRFVEGRQFGPGDGPETPPVALVSRVLVERYFDGASPLGRRVRLDDEGPWITVVGVVDDVVQDWISGQRRPTVYRPFAQDPTLRVTLLVRSARPVSELAAALRRTVQATDPDQPILKLAPMTQVVSDRLSGIGYFADVLTAMSVLALVLALSGMYSLMAYIAARRTREFGVRVALGATRAQVTWLGISRALGIAGGGLALGGVLAVASVRCSTSPRFRPWCARSTAVSGA